MRHNNGIKKWLRGLGIGSGEKDLTVNGINGLIMGDAPRSTRITLWSCLAFFVALIVWAANAPIDEVARGEGKAIPSSRL